MTTVVPKDPTVLGEMGRALLEDKNGKALGEYRTYFEAALFQARKKLSLPLTQEKQSINQAMVDCTSAAVVVINAVWDAMHSGR